MVRIKIRYLALKKISYFWFPQGIIIFPGGVRQKRNFRRGGGVRFGNQFLENREGRGVIGKISSVGGYGYFLELHNAKLLGTLKKYNIHLMQPRCCEWCKYSSHETASFTCFGTFWNINLESCAEGNVKLDLFYLSRFAK